MRTLFFLLAMTGAAQAQTLMTQPANNGNTLTTDSRGHTYLTQPMGNGMSLTTDDRGRSFTTMPMNNQGNQPQFSGYPRN